MSLAFDPVAQPMDRMIEIASGVTRPIVMVNQIQCLDHEIERQPGLALLKQGSRGIRRGKVASSRHVDLRANGHASAYPVNR